MKYYLKNHLKSYRFELSPLQGKTTLLEQSRLMTEWSGSLNWYLNTTLIGLKDRCSTTFHSHFTLVKHKLIVLTSHLH